MVGSPIEVEERIVTAGVITRRRRRSGFALDLSGWIGIGLLATILLLSLVGPLLVERPQADTSQILQGVSWSHPFGTDVSGKDNLALVIHGGWDMLMLAFVAGVLTTAIALVVGMVSASSGGRVDQTLTYITDLWLTIPRFILLLVVASLIDLNSTASLAALMALFGWPYLARQVRALTLSVEQRPFVEAAKSLGHRFWFIARRCFFPAMAPFLIIATIQAMTQAIFQQVGLSFFGIIPLTDNWGTQFSVAYGQNALYSTSAAPSVLAPVLAIVLLQLGLVLTSRALESRFDPRLDD